MGEHERGRTSARELALLWQRAPTRQAGSPEPWEECSCGAHSTAHTTRTTHMSAHLCVREPWASVDAPWRVSWRCHTTACLGSTVPGTGCRIRTEPMPRSEKDVLLPVPTAQRTRRERRVSAHLCIRGHGVGEHERGRTSARELALLRQRAPTRQAGSPEPRESAPVGAHSTAHTTRTTHVSAHLCIRGSWRGRARAWTHLGTRAAGAGR
jgi:hypothetical protein